MYRQKLLKLFYVIIIAAIVAAAAGFFIFEMNWTFLPFPLLAGVAIVLTQKENSTIKLLDKILIGSFLYGFLALFLVYVRMYLVGLIFHSDFPFWPLYNSHEYIMGSLVFGFVCLLGAMAGVVIKGGYHLFKSS
jgi:hypothetical protein